MKRYEVFCPATGNNVCVVPFACLARFICRLFAPVHFFDWAEEGEAWLI